MHLHAPAVLASTFWYPNHVGSFGVNHKRFGSPNGPFASLRRTSHSSSIGTIMVIPKLRGIIMDKRWLRNFTTWTILTLMSLRPTSVANTTFVLACWSIALVYAHLCIPGLVSCYRSLIALDMHLRHCCCQNRSDWFLKPVRPVWYWQHHRHLWTCFNVVSMLFALVAYPLL